MLSIILAAQGVVPTLPPTQPEAITVVGRAVLAETPSTVSRLDLEELSRTQGITTLADALSLVPGLQVVETGPVGAQASIFIRGTDSDHTLATYDGIRLNSPATPNGAYSFGSDLLPEGVQVEVLRGPASATYGSDAIGGVVNVRPSPKAGGAVNASVGELDTKSGSAHVSGQDGAFHYVIGAAYQSTDGWDAVPGRIVSAERGGERDGGEGYGLLADLDYALSDGIALSLVAMRRESVAEFDSFSGGPSFAQRADDPDLELEDTLSVLRAGVTVTPTDSLSVTANAGLVDGSFVETDGSVRTGDVDGRRRFAELLVRYDAGPATISAGSIYENEAADIPISFNDPLDVEEDHVGAFVFAQAEAAPDLILSGTARLDDYDGFGTPFTWNAGAAYTIGGLRLRANAGTAYNAPSLAERFSTSAFNAGNPDLQEETGFAVEAAIGHVLETAAGALTTEIVLFRTDTDDLIEYDFASLANVNVGDARTQGAELSLGWAGRRLQAFAAYTYTDAENRDTGADLLRRPEHGVTANASWVATDRLTLSGRWVRTGERPDVTYDDAGFFAGTDEVDGFDEVAATARYAVTDRLSGLVTVTNLLSETYEQPAAFGSAPRRVRLGLRYGW